LDCLKKIAAGLTSGALGSAFANPTDLVKIRLQAEAGKIVDGVYVSGLFRGKPPTYRNTFHALYHIYQYEGGIRALYKGVGATMIRASFLTAAQLASYDHSKYLLKAHNILQEGVALHIVASLIAGLCATTAAAPADLLKSRYMADGAGTTRLYSSVLDCLVKTVRTEGPQALLRGWVPSYARLGPHFIIALPILEQSRRLFGLGYL